jgi:hypothetical protein
VFVVGIDAVILKWFIFGLRVVFMVGFEGVGGLGWVFHIVGRYALLFLLEKVIIGLVVHASRTVVLTLLVLTHILGFGGSVWPCDVLQARLQIPIADILDVVNQVGYVLPML